MTRTQWKNLYSAYRYARWGCTYGETIGWIRFWNPLDAVILTRLFTY